jgi:hypothetical protein
MKKSTLISVLLLSCLSRLGAAEPTSSKPAPASNVPPVLNENDRLKQDYQAHRAAWVRLRQKALDEAKKAKTDDEKKRIMKKLETDERALRAASADLAHQVHEAEKTQLQNAKPSGK